jgi:hypothetical protein
MSTPTTIAIVNTSNMTSITSSSSSPMNISPPSSPKGNAPIFRLQDVKAIKFDTTDMGMDGTGNNFYVPLTFVCTSSTRNEERKSVMVDAGNPMKFNPLIKTDKDQYAESKTDHVTVFPDKDLHKELMDGMAHVDNLMVEFLKTNQAQLTADRKKCKQRGKKPVNASDEKGVQGGAQEG